MEQLEKRWWVDGEFLSGIDQTDNPRIIATVGNNFSATLFNEELVLMVKHWIDKNCVGETSIGAYSYISFSNPEDFILAKMSLPK